VKENQTLIYLNEVLNISGVSTKVTKVQGGVSEVFPFM
jgi:hypothetical protein